MLKKLGGKDGIPDYGSAWDTPVDPTRPTAAWLKLTKEKRQFIKKAAGVDPRSEKPEGALRCVCISDTHSRMILSELPPGDVLVHAGDFTEVGGIEEIEKFSQFLKDQTQYRHKVVIAGNHDLTLDRDKYEYIYQSFHEQMLNVDAARAALTNCTYLEDSMVEIDGVSFYGTPYQPTFCDWGFNLPRGQECLDKWKEIPAGVDVLITHGPPLGHGDMCFSQQRAGCVDLLQQVQTRVKPQYHVFGHIHEGHGVTTDGVTTYVNASTCTLRYKATQPPIVIDVFPQYNCSNSTNCKRVALWDDGHEGDADSSDTVEQNDDERAEGKETAAEETQAVSK